MKAILEFIVFGVLGQASLLVGLMAMVGINNAKEKSVSSMYRYC